MTSRQDENAGEIPFSWFGKTLWKFTPLYIELIFLAICLRLIGLVEPFIFQVIIDRILPFQREASLLVVVAIFIAVSLFQLGFEVLSEPLGMLTANRVTREFGARIFEAFLQNSAPAGFTRRIRSVKRLGMSKSDPARSRMTNWQSCKKP